MSNDWPLIVENDDSLNVNVFEHLGPTLRLLPSGAEMLHPSLRNYQPDFETTRTNGHSFSTPQRSDSLKLFYMWSPQDLSSEKLDTILYCNLDTILAEVKPRASVYMRRGPYRIHVRLQAGCAFHDRNRNNTVHLARGAYKVVAHITESAKLYRNWVLKETIKYLSFDDETLDEMAPNLSEDVIKLMRPLANVTARYHDTNEGTSLILLKNRVLASDDVLHAAIVCVNTCGPVANTAYEFVHDKNSMRLSGPDDTLRVTILEMIPDTALS